MTLFGVMQGADDGGRREFVNQKEEDTKVTAIVVAAGGQSTFRDAVPGLSILVGTLAAGASPAFPMARFTALSSLSANS
jgi:hypothetical protein